MHRGVTQFKRRRRPEIRNQKKERDRPGKKRIGGGRIEDWKVDGGRRTEDRLTGRWRMSLAIETFVIGREKTSENNEARIKAKLYK